MKHVVGVIVWLATASVGYAQHPQSQLQVHKFGDNAFMMTLYSRTSHSIEATRLELMREAKRLCGTRLIHFGQYKFHAESSTGLSC